jgi:hypothetical protein
MKHADLQRLSNMFIVRIKLAAAPNSSSVAAASDTVSDRSA